MKFKDKEAEIKFLIKVIEAKEAILINYRLGIHKAPASWVFNAVHSYEDYKKENKDV